MTHNRSHVSAAISAENSGTDWLMPGKGQPLDGSIKAVTSSTVHLQRKRPGEADADARDVDAFIAAEEIYVEQAGEWLYRLFVKTGNKGADTPVLELNT